MIIFKQYDTLYIIGMITMCNIYYILLYCIMEILLSL